MWKIAPHDVKVGTGTKILKGNLPWIVFLLGAYRAQFLHHLVKVIVS